MKVTEYAKILSDRVNQEHYVLYIMNKVYALGVKNINDIKKQDEDKLLNYLGDKITTLINSLSDNDVSNDTHKHTNILGKIDAYSDVMLYIKELSEKNKQ